MSSIWHLRFLSSHISFPVFQFRTVFDIDILQKLWGKKGTILALKQFSKLFHEYDLVMKTYLKVDIIPKLKWI